MSRDFFYLRSYGLSLRSSIKLPYFYQIAESSSCLIDAEIVQSKVAPTGLQTVIEQGLCFQVNEQELWLDVPKIARFLVQKGQTILFEPYPGIDKYSLSVFLSGPCMAALLMQRDLFVLSGGVIKENEAAVAYIGDECSGKSSLISFKALHGCLVLADNLCVINKNGLVYPGPHSIELWENSTQDFNSAADKLHPIRPGIKKYNWSPEHGFYQHPLPLHLIYVLNPQKRSASMVTELRGSAKINYLQKHFYNKSYLSGLKKNSLYFQYCANIAQRITMSLVEFDVHAFDVNNISDLIAKEPA